MLSEYKTRNKWRQYKPVNYMFATFNIKIWLQLSIYLFLFNSRELNKLLSKVRKASLLQIHVN